MKKVLLVLSACLLALSGCSGNTGGSKNGGVEITMWLIGSEGQALAINEIARDFYKKTGISVQCDAISWGDAHSKYLTSIAGGVAPDIGTIGLTWGAEFGKLGSMVNLKERYGPEVQAIKEQVFPGLWNSIEYNDKVYGIPFDMTEYILYYRTDIVAKPPATWNELVKVLADLNKNGKGMIFDWGSLSWIGYSPFLWQAGGDFYNRDYTRAAVDDAAAVTAMNFFADLYKKYNVPKTKIPIEQGMRTGDFPLAISGNWKIDELSISAPEIAGKWAIAMLPQGPGGKRTAFIGGRILGIFSQSKHKDEAWQFIKYLFTPEVQSKLYEAAFARQDAYLPPSRPTWDLIKMDPAFKRVLVEQANDAKGPPPIADWDANSKFIDEAIQKVILQSGDTSRELETANKMLNKMLKK